MLIISTPKKSNTTGYLPMPAATNLLIMLQRSYAPALLSMLIILLAMPARAQKPAITAISPVSASYGQTVTIEGSNFAVPANLQVRFGGAVAPILSATSGSVQVSVPAGAATAPLTITNLNSGLMATSAARFLPSFRGEGIDPARFMGQAPLAGKAGIKQLAINDLNGDGKNDIAFSATASSSITVYQNTSTTSTYSFSPVSINLGAPSRGLTAADLNGDGKPELIYTGFDGGGNLLFLLRNTSTTSTVQFASASFLTTPTNGATRLEVLDLNNDGKPEIVVSDEITAKLYIFVNQSTGTTLSFQAAPVQVALPGANAYGLQLQDLNGDGKPDLIAANYLIGNVYYLLNESTATTLAFKAPQTILQGITSVLELKVGDLNGDGKPDLALTDNFANQVVIGLNQSTGTSVQFSAIHKISLQTTGAWDLDLADLDGDGLLDIALSHQNAAKCTILKNKGFSDTPAFQEYTLATTGKSTALKIADLNGDTRPDILYTNIEVNTLSILSNTLCPKPTLAQQCTGSGIRLVAPKFPSASYNWFKDGTLLTVSNSESMQVTETGSYTVGVQLSGCNALSPSFPVTSVSGFPGAPSFAAIKPICEGENLVLLVNSPVSGSAYTWQNANGFSATTTTNSYTIPAATASHAGSYWVKVKVGECEITLTSPGPASVATPPSPSITPSRTGLVCAGEAVTLSVASAYVSYQWKKDGQSLSGKTTNVLLITEPGAYTVSVGVTGNCTGESAAYTFQPAATASASFVAPATACLGQPVQFSNRSATASNQVVRYLWDFGDGTTSTEQSPQHTYSSTNASPYTVTLKVGYGSNFSCGHTFSKTISVIEPEVVSLEASATEFCAGEEITVRVVGSAQAVQWSNGMQGTSISTTEGGTLQASITTVGGCTLTQSIELLRRPLPQLQLSADSKLINVGESVRLTASGGTNYQWSPAEGLDNPSSASPLASPKRTTTYTVTSLSPEGCMGSAEITIEVSTVFNVKIPKIFVPQVDGLWHIPNIEEYPLLSLQVVNSLGQPVMEASPYFNTWDGTKQGNPLAAGVYYYIFKDQNKKVVRTGSITLMR